MDTPPWRPSQNCAEFFCSSSVVTPLRLPAHPVAWTGPVAMADAVTVRQTQKPAGWLAVWTQADGGGAEPEAQDATVRAQQFAAFAVRLGSAF